MSRRLLVVVRILKIFQNNEMGSSAQTLYFIVAYAVSSFGFLLIKGMHLMQQSFTSQYFKFLVTLEMDANN